MKKPEYHYQNFIIELDDLQCLSDEIADYGLENAEIIHIQHLKTNSDSARQYEIFFKIPE
jgi:hypothetical protein